MMLKSLLLVSFLLFVADVNAHENKDSVRVEQLLASANLLREDADREMFFARQLLGTPYVASTLDRDIEETLVINIRELDCTTFVENVVALTLCSKKELMSFHDFADMLRQIRYRGGNVSYCSRLHYFTEWMEDNETMGFVKKIESAKAPFTALQKLNINYMSTHSSAYFMLRHHPEWLSEIKEMERKLTGRTYNYIPKSAINNSKLLRETIHDGDIIAILTNKKGLDTSHIGIAVWHKDGLHLINASQIHKKVVEEPMLFRTYMQKHPSQIGIRLCRIV